MKEGSNRPAGQGRLVNTFQDWINGSIGATMFFNARSAALQTLSTVNFVNWSDNNPLRAGKAFANQKQYWTDFGTIFNSPFLKQRRSGLQKDVNAREMVKTIKGAKNPINEFEKKFNNKAYFKDVIKGIQKVKKLKNKPHSSNLLLST